MANSINIGGTDGPRVSQISRRTHNSDATYAGTEFTDLDGGNSDIQRDTEPSDAESVASSVIDIDGLVLFNGDETTQQATFDPDRRSTTLGDHYTGGYTGLETPPSPGRYSASSDEVAPAGYFELRVHNRAVPETAVAAPIVPEEVPTVSLPTTILPIPSPDPAVLQSGFVDNDDDSLPDLSDPRSSRRAPKPLSFCQRLYRCGLPDIDSDAEQNSAAHSRRQPRSQQLTSSIAPSTSDQGYGRGEESMTMPNSAAPAVLRRTTTPWAPTPRTGRR